MTQNLPNKMLKSDAHSIAYMNKKSNLFGLYILDCMYARVTYTLLKYVQKYEDVNCLSNTNVSHSITLIVNE